MKLIRKLQINVNFMAKNIFTSEFHGGRYWKYKEVWLRKVILSTVAYWELGSFAAIDKLWNTRRRRTPVSEGGRTE
jgi:hypothetical protein